MGSVAALFVTSYARPATKHQTARSIVFWDGRTRSGVRMQTIDRFWRPSEKEQKERMQAAWRRANEAKRLKKKLSETS